MHFESTTQRDIWIIACMDRPSSWCISSCNQIILSSVPASSSGLKGFSSILCWVYITAASQSMEVIVSPMTITWQCMMILSEIVDCGNMIAHAVLVPTIHLLCSRHNDSYYYVYTPCLLLSVNQSP